MSPAFLISCLAAMLASALALTVVFSARRLPAHWFFVIGMVLLAGESLAVGLAGEAVFPDEFVFWMRLSLLAQAFLPSVWLAFSLTYGRGDAAGQLEKWRLPLVLLFLLPAGLAVFSADSLISSSEESLEAMWAVRLSRPGGLLNTVFLVGCVLILMNLERTYRAAIGTMRWRIKFMILGLGLLFAVRAYTASQVLLFTGVSISLEVVNSAALLLANLLLFRSLFRSGNFEVGVYPSQSVITNSLTVLIAGIYLLVVGLFANAVSSFGGQSAFALQAFLVLVAIVSLVILLLSDRVRLQTKRFISRNFQRPIYDYRTVWQTVTDRTARCMKESELCEVTATLSSEIFEALSVTIWLLDDSRERLCFAASTSATASTANQLLPTTAESAEIIAALKSHPDPVDLDASREGWAPPLRRAHPGQFRTGGNRVCVPMIAAGELLGLMILGDRVGGVSFSLQDFDLLKSVASQAAAGLLNLQLSHKLSQSRQLEAFQAMSAFFVHDLKNTASTLSLMLQNLPVHYHDPQFREDALRGISKTVDHINDVISRLNMLRHDLALQVVDCDLNEIVKEALPPPSGADVQITQDLQPLPKLRLDVAQIQKVVTNLLLNAREAIASGGEVRIQTSRRASWVVLSVQDTGCGIPPEFMQQNLFRPFQTTKKNGIGIGMFHCKMIVEAHQGRIEVESQPGQGATFRVLLPIPPSA